MLCSPRSFDFWTRRKAFYSCSFCFVKLLFIEIVFQAFGQGLGNTVGIGNNCYERLFRITENLGIFLTAQLVSDSASAL